MNNAANWIHDGIRDLSSYHVQDSQGCIKLDAMENPYTWSKSLRTAWANLLSQTDVNRYPDPQATRLVAQMKATMAIATQTQLLLGNGSDEIIQMIAMAVGSGSTLLTVEPSFSMYRIIATCCGLKYVGVPLNTGDYSLDMPTLLHEIERHQPAVIFLAYPNNPTGNLFNTQDIHTVIKAAPGLVIVDEAYAPFTQASFIPELGQYANLAIMGTLSKMGLAGLRLGFLAGPVDWLQAFEKVRLPYNINTLTQVSAQFALKNKAIFDQQSQAICNERERLFQLLKASGRFTVFTSQANFILLKTPRNQADEYFNRLKQKGILIKNLHGSHPLLEDCLRITIGTPTENDLLLKHLCQ